MKNLFQNILDNYIDGTNKVNNDSKIYKILVNQIPKEISTILNRTRDLSVHGSMGKGNKTVFPWISILNKNITRTTQEGIYVVYLFKSDMTGFYLTLNQGITNFERKFGRDKYKYLDKVTEYFKSEFEDTFDFSKGLISLNANKNTRGSLYERSTILSKYYETNNFTEEELIDDLKSMIEAYDLIYSHMQDSSYDTLINDVINGDKIYIPVYDAIPAIEHKLQETPGYPRNQNKRLIEVQAQAEKSKKFKRIIEGSNTKMDYLHKAQQDAYTGLEGENLVLIYEQERLINLGYPDYANKVDWVAQRNDVAGFDIKSYDVDNNGKIHEIYIEVKTSVSKIDTDFYVSKNEVETSHEYENTYRVFRIYDVLSLEPKFYIAKGKIEDNFNLEPVTFRASYKWKLESQNHRF